MTTVDALSAFQNDHTSLIRRVRNFGVWVADYSVTDLVRSALFDATTGKLTSGALSSFSGVGLSTDDGAKIAQSITRETVTSIQSTAPSLSYKTADSLSVTVEPQEVNAAVIALQTNQKIAGTWTTTPDAGGSLSYDRPETSTDTEYRCVILFEDQNADGKWYVGYSFPRVTCDPGDRQMQKTGIYSSPFTLNIQYDSAAGTDAHMLWGGDGWLAALTDIGLTAGDDSSSS